MNQSVVETAGKIADKIVTQIPPIFLFTLLINCLFIGMLFWFLSTQQADRTLLLSKTIDVCVASIRSTTQLQDMIHNERVANTH